MKDNVLARMSFDTATCFTSIQQIAMSEMNYLEEELIKIFKDEISRNGNGSGIMVQAAEDAVHEISREVTNEFIEYSVGIDEDQLRGMSIDTYVRVMTVIHGNNADGPLHSKPGQVTFRKHVLTHGISTAKTIYNLPDGFNWPVDVAGHINRNAVKRIQLLFTEAISRISQAVTSDLLSSFVIMG